MKASPWKVLITAAAEFSRDRVPVLGAALAYYSAFSIAPLVMISLGITGIIFGEEAARGETTKQLTQLLGADGARFVEGVIASTQSEEKSLLGTVVGTSVLIFGATGVFTQLQEALNTIWHVDSVRSGFISQIVSRWTSFTMVLGLSFLLLVSLIFSSFVALLTGAMPFYGTLSLALVEMINVSVSFAVTTLVFLLIFRVLPGVRLAWRDVLLSALLTAALFTIGKTLLGIYIGRAAVASSFGAAGTAIVLLVWVYYSAQILLFGAECTAVAVRLTGRDVELKSGFAFTTLTPEGNSPFRRHVTSDKSCGGISEG